jgi:hypothetical protein
LKPLTGLLSTGKLCRVRRVCKIFTRYFRAVTHTRFDRFDIYFNVHNWDIYFISRNFGLQKSEEYICIRLYTILDIYFCVIWVDSINIYLIRRKFGLQQSEELAVSTKIIVLLCHPLVKAYILLQSNVFLTHFKAFRRPAFHSTLKAK